MNQIEMFLRDHPESETEVYALGGNVGGTAELDLSVLPQVLVDEIVELTAATDNFTDTEIVEIEKENLKLIEKIITDFFPAALQPMIDRQISVEEKGKTKERVKAVVTEQAATDEAEEQKLKAIAEHEAEIQAINDVIERYEATIETYQEMLSEVPKKDKAIKEKYQETIETYQEMLSEKKDDLKSKTEN